MPANTDTLSNIWTESSFTLSSELNHRCHSNLSPLFPNAVCLRQLNSMLIQCPPRTGVQDQKARPAELSNRTFSPSPPYGPGRAQARWLRKPLPAHSPSLLNFHSTELSSLNEYSFSEKLLILKLKKKKGTYHKNRWCVPKLTIVKVSNIAASLSKKKKTNQNTIDTAEWPLPVPVTTPGCLNRHSAPPLSQSPNPDDLRDCRNRMALDMLLYSAFTSCFKG